VRLRRGRADELQFAIGWPDAAHRKQGRRCAARDRRTRCAVVLVPSGDAKVGLTTQADFIVSLAPVCRGRGAFEAADHVRRGGGPPAAGVGSSLAVSPVALLCASVNGE
jgi:hypothetical protein